LFLANDVVGQINAVGADVNVGGTFDHRANVAGGLPAERAGGDASPTEAARRDIAAASAPARTAGGRRSVGSAAVAGASGVGHRKLCLPCVRYRALACDRLRACACHESEREREQKNKRVARAAARAGPVRVSAGSDATVSYRT